MVVSEYSTDNYKSSKISRGAIMKSPKMLRLVPDHLKTKKMGKHTVKKLSFVIRYDPGQYRTQQMYDKAVQENGGTLECVTYW